MNAETGENVRIKLSSAVMPVEKKPLILSQAVDTVVLMLSHTADNRVVILTQTTENHVVRPLHAV